MTATLFVIRLYVFALCDTGSSVVLTGAAWPAAWLDGTVSSRHFVFCYMRQEQQVS